ncbi:MAG TPA: hypothetical protein VHC70_12935 [Phycisphaerales bacterium]|nr:hypothetical protein [Phycisphaerales bacterium]
MDIRGKCVLGALTLAAVTSASMAQVVTRDLYYTRFRGLPSGEANVKRASISYDRATSTLTINNKVDIARTEYLIAPNTLQEGADGIAFHPDGDLLVGGEITGRMFKVNRATGTYTSMDVGQIDCFHVKVGPDGQTAYTAGLNDPFSSLATVPLQPFASGTSHAITGSENLITDVVFVPASSSPPGFPNGRVFYTRSGTAGNGNFGIIDLSTFTTTQVISGVDYAHGIQFDTYSNTILLFGEHQVAQWDPSTLVPTFVGAKDFSATFPTLDLDQGSVDGHGLVFAASNDGYLFAMDYTTTRNIVASASTASLAFLDSFLDDIAPLDIVPQNTCCEIGSGDFDGRDGQQSQLPGLAAPGSFDYRVADDFYLLPDRIYHITSIEGTLLTDANPSTLPKAQLEFYEDCNGLPSNAGPFRVELQATSMVATGTALGLTKYLVTFNISDLWLKGGKSYWVSLIGKGLSDPNERWYWGTAGNGMRSEIRGRPGAFKSVSGGTPNWTSFDGPPCPGCIGCTDFAFCVHGTSCKILNDQSNFATAAGSGTLSLVNAGLTYAQTADDFVIPACLSGTVCYIEAYIATNCTSARMDVFESDCTSRTVAPPNVGGPLPSGLTPYRTLIPDKIEQVTTNGLPVSQGGIPLTMTFPNLPPAGGTIDLNVYRLVFYSPGLTLTAGRDWWLSAYGFETGNTSHVAYFLYASDCRRPCAVRWQEGAIWGPRYQAGNAADPLRWVPVSTIAGLGGPHDYAFLVAIDDGLAPPFANGQPQACSADFNGVDGVTPQDIFDFLNAWFAGCP